MNRSAGLSVNSGASFAPMLNYSGHVTRARHDRFHERDHLDELGD